MSQIIAPKTVENTQKDTITGTSIISKHVAGVLSIVDLNNTIWQYSLLGLINLDNLSIGNYVTFSGCTNVNNNGSFRVEGLSQTNKTIDVRNSNGVAQGAQDGQIELSWELHALNVKTINDPAEETLVSLSHNIEGRSGRLAITDAAAVEVKTGLSVLEGRETMIIRNVGIDDVYFGFDNTVISGASIIDATVSSFVLKINDSLEIDLGPSITLFARCATGKSGTLHIMELS